MSNPPAPRPTPDHRPDPPPTDEPDDDHGEQRSDTDLLAAVRAGDEAAYGQLWTRHEAAARRAARQMTRPSNAEDLVSESFYRVLRTIKNGHGPAGAFRPYLFSTMRRYLIDNARSYDQRIVLTGDISELDGRSAPGADEQLADRLDRAHALAAWSALPDSSRTLLWHLLIEEEPPSVVAGLLGTTPNGISSRAVRAKERLRQAFLTQQLATVTDETCRVVRSMLGAHVRGALSGRDRCTVEAHLPDCLGCTAALDEVADLNRTLRSALVPLVLGGPTIAGRYLAATHAAAVATMAMAAVGMTAIALYGGSGGGSIGGATGGGPPVPGRLVEWDPLAAGQFTVGPIAVPRAGLAAALTPPGWRVVGATVDGRPAALTRAAAGVGDGTVRIRVRAGDDLRLRLTGESRRPGTLCVVVPPYAVAAGFTEYRTYRLS